jgi:hypothetical protein
MESRETKLCNKLYKTGKEQQIFLVFQILKQELKEIANKAKSFWIFKYQTENRKQSKPKLENYIGKQKGNNEIFLVFLCFGK